MRLFLAALFGFLLCSPAQAQTQTSPAQMGITSTTAPEVVQVLDNTKTWVPLGSVDPTTHTTIGLGKEFYVRQFSPHNDWVGDDGPAIAAALSAASAAGGGTVYLDQVSYWNQTQALTVPVNVHLRCVGAFTKFGVNYAYLNHPCSIYQKSGTSLTVFGRLTDVGVFWDQVHFQPIAGMTRAQWTAFHAGFAGIGVALGGLASDPTGTQLVGQNVLIGGFATCVANNTGATLPQGSSQMQLRQILGDCDNGLDINSSYDNNFLSDLEFWPFLTTAQSGFSSLTWPITAIADNGSGAWRVTYTTGTAPALATGEQIWVYPGNGSLGGAGPGGSGSAGLWTVTAVDSTHIDLQGSVTQPATTGTTTTGVTYVAVASTNDLQIGMNVSGAGIPAGAIIGAVWRSRPAISLDPAHPATASGSGVALSFTSVPFTTDANAVIAWSANERIGTGFAIGRADGTSCSGCFSFGHRIGFNFRDAIFTSFTNSNQDGYVTHVPNKNAPNVIGVEFTGISYSNYFQTNVNSTAGVHVLSTANSSPANVVQVTNPSVNSNNSTILEKSAGTLTMVNGSMAQGGNILLDLNGVNPATILMGLYMPNVLLYGTGFKPIFNGAGNTFAGQFDQRSPVQAITQRMTIASNAAPVIDWYSSGEILDQKYWRYNYSGGSAGLCLQALTDGYASPFNAFCSHRSGATVTDTTFSSPLIQRVYAIAGLPACNASLLGATAAVNNGQATPPYLGAVSTTGAVVASVFCNGSGWVYH